MKTQNIREEFITSFLKDCKFLAKLSTNDREWLVDFFLAYHNATLKELEEEVGNMKHELGQEEFYENTDNEWRKEGFNKASDRIKQLIHQKLIQ